MLSLRLILAIGVGMGSLATLYLVCKQGREDSSFADQGDARAYRNNIDTQVVRTHMPLHAHIGRR